jgi:hypothetical protein
MHHLALNNIHGKLRRMRIKLLFFLLVFQYIRDTVHVPDNYPPGEIVVLLFAYQLWTDTGSIKYHSDCWCKILDEYLPRCEILSPGNRIQQSLTHITGFTEF